MAVAKYNEIGMSLRQAGYAIFVVVVGLVISSGFEVKCPDDENTLNVLSGAAASAILGAGIGALMENFLCCGRDEDIVSLSCDTPSNLLASGLVFVVLAAGLTTAAVILHADNLKDCRGG